MCTNYVASTRQELAAKRLGVLELPHEDWPDEIYPGYSAPILLRGAGDGVLCRLARFGLVPRWCRDAAQAQDIGRKTYNARSETAAEKPSYRAPWQARQWALARMNSFFEPCWEEAAHNGGRAVRWQIGRSGDAPFAVAGLWESWRNPQDGTLLDSFTLLTVNADGHAVMGRMHKPGEEKRMPVLVDEAHYHDWLQATPQSAVDWMQAWPASDLQARPAPRVAL
ncbi:MAG: SOS response-associated peptidase family protein, partial [Rhodoferax sp.]|nr:SOS response-associated peptidase family protein [Rhodoferax sp.]